MKEKNKYDAKEGKKLSTYHLKKRSRMKNTPVAGCIRSKNIRRKLTIVDILVFTVSYNIFQKKRYDVYRKKGDD